MTRTQIQLTEAQLQALQRVSAETGESIAALIREGVELYLRTRLGANRQDQIERALRVAGKFSSGTKDTSTEHDRYLTETFGQ